MIMTIAISVWSTSKESIEYNQRNIKETSKESKESTSIKGNGNIQT